MVYLPTFAIFYHQKQPNVGKYTSPMDGMGNGMSRPGLVHVAHKWLESLPSPWDVIDFQETNNRGPFSPSGEKSYVR